MALRNILKVGDPGLLKKSRVIADFNERLHILLDDMRETLAAASGLGIAAPQVGVLRRAVLVVDVPAAPEPGDEADAGKEADEAEDSEKIEIAENQIIELINPELICGEGEQQGSEGCLSLPGMHGMVTRPQKVKVKAQDRFGEKFELEASDMTARAICHEIDHLNGVIFTSVAERMLTEEEIKEMQHKQDSENKRQ